MSNRDRYKISSLNQSVKEVRVKQQSSSSSCVLQIYLNTTKSIIIETTQEKLATKSRISTAFLSQVMTKSLDQQKRDKTRQIATPTAAVYCKSHTIQSIQTGQHKKSYSDQNKHKTHSQPSQPHLPSPLP